MTCRTRFAPSPTGYLHIGGARTALYCWLEARHRGGQFVLRIEDTDRERSTQEAIDAILEAMEWLGLGYDEGPIYQTQRVARYQEVAEQLLAQGKAYYAYETRAELDAMREAAMAKQEKPRYNGAAREQNLPYRDDPNRVIRFKNPQAGTVVFDDLIKGRIEIANSELDDMVIFRPDGFPTYNFAVVVDDWDMGITEVIRGDDHINNTPRQINIYEALGAPVPKFAHMPMILDEQGAKLSKRTGAADVMQYRDAGYLPHALINYLARLGWSHGDQELFTQQELLDLFDVKDVNSKAARLDMAKLGWVNQHYLKTDDPASIAPQLEYQLAKLGIDVAAGPAAADVVVALRERVQTLKEMAEKAVVWYQPLETYDEAAVIKHLKLGAEVPLGKARELLAGVSEWSVESVSAALHDAAAALELGMGKVAQPLRVAITGTQVSPDISQTVYLAGREGALKRIDAALIKIGAG
ncbi:glutamate--tRNA ligase [Xanthomonas hortorum]|uniref:Glutamate--tRNA ligase n=1 Tax=Xanthomonas hortorum pv. gardneri TaxID=2754056 RepID=A0A6V7CLX5_9XANT|nr:glutamate--tRNA ligase [Xanthomonas hortorum]MCC4626845.1 glutamate--tRNA ligase [Xanthomonas campestris pv. nigromaculans]APP81358.1 glutamate--tRNA ligase [Xanthomonas hortorum pv. gardneri]EGD17134.1 glutamyl-tRNA synthetase [Xanthomonas hortorum ATCC 19865]KLA93070.1 glutamyl-tRNA synthetase [Xanthomonas hortorum pv. gardneri]KLA93770.1 glutamyl-tRNA synthetase [Xanthomonas hortorum pv. gardneri]